MFAPLEKIGLIVIDEEQEGAYASQQSPRYHARDIARALSSPSGAAAAGVGDPSVETFYQAQRGRIRLYTPTHRYLGEPAAEGADCRFHPKLWLSTSARS